MQKAEDCLKAEEGRVAAYLHINSKGKLMHKVPLCCLHLGGLHCPVSCLVDCLKQHCVWRPAAPSAYLHSTSKGELMHEVAASC